MTLRLRILWRLHGFGFVGYARRAVPRSLSMLLVLEQGRGLGPKRRSPFGYVPLFKMFRTWT
jgi:hypothetical protein